MAAGRRSATSSRCTSAPRAEDLLVVRLKGGDPALFGALEPELSAARERGLACEIVPGVSALRAAAAALGCEIATPGGAAARSPTRSGSPRRPPSPACVAVYGAGRDPRALQRGLRDRGLAGVDAVRASRSRSRGAARRSCACPLDELAETLEDMAPGC